MSRQKKEQLNKDLYNSLSTLVTLIGLIDFKYEGQREVLQEAVDQAIMLMKDIELQEKGV
jgi:hypothetical protein